VFPSTDRKITFKVYCQHIEKITVHVQSQHSGQHEEWLDCCNTVVDYQQRFKYRRNTLIPNARSTAVISDLTNAVYHANALRTEVGLPILHKSQMIMLGMLFVHFNAYFVGSFFLR